MILYNICWTAWKGENGRLVISWLIALILLSSLSCSVGGGRLWRSLFSQTSTYCPGSERDVWWLATLRPSPLHSADVPAKKKSNRFRTVFKEISGRSCWVKQATLRPTEEDSINNYFSLEMPLSEAQSLLPEVLTSGNTMIPCVT